MKRRGERERERKRRERNRERDDGFHDVGREKKRREERV